MMHTKFQCFPSLLTYTSYALIFILELILSFPEFSRLNYEPSSFFSDIIFYYRCLVSAVALCRCIALVYIPQDDQNGVTLVR